MVWKLFDSSDILEGWVRLFCCFWRGGVFNFYLLYFSFTELFQSAEDFIVDVPKLWEYVAELVEPLFEDDGIDLDFLTQLSSILNPTLVVDFSVAVLKELVNTLVITKVCVRWLDAISSPPGVSIIEKTKKKTLELWLTMSWELNCDFNVCFSLGCCYNSKNVEPVARWKCATWC